MTTDDTNVTDGKQLSVASVTSVVETLSIQRSFRTCVRGFVVAVGLKRCLHFVLLVRIIVFTNFLLTLTAIEPFRPRRE